MLLDGSLTINRDTEDLTLEVAADYRGCRTRVRAVLTSGQARLLAESLLAGADELDALDEAYAVVEPDALEKPVLVNRVAGAHLANLDRGYPNQERGR